MSRIADKGDVRAQRWMGLMLHNGGRYREAMSWYVRAVNQGDGYAAGQIADFHSHGIGVPEDRVEATKWLLRGALLGDSGSQRDYASALRSGEHVRADAGRAFAWYLSAAKQRDRYAYFPLAEMAAAGEGTERNLIRAYAFAKAAEESGDSSETARATNLKVDLRKKLTRPDIAQAEAQFAALRPDLVERRARRDQKQFEILASVVGLLLGGLAIRLHLRRSSRSMSG
jgi:TPR repeat protein